ncbi:MAG: hypothetical protein CEO22_73 [Candidatus Berkelbacteria bacterium Gr01-1014_85]|uniref:Uncharacterized protein n=1 Tax=Candidatus Berkelbacteria bacterium Gr01-1014_85 TaxID=2017150 RepID=A0A554JDP8_9BACT|nr:MAG: hypothetical protein CEO22_73 [Candidatus Berkelbacteria bacterium Gr01-1014_85]
MNRSRARLSGLEVNGETIMALAVSGMTLLYLALCLWYRLESDRVRASADQLQPLTMALTSTANYRALIEDLKRSNIQVFVHSVVPKVVKAPDTRNAWAPLPANPPLVLTLSIALTPILAHCYSLEYEADRDQAEYHKLRELSCGDRVNFQYRQLSSLSNDPAARLPTSEVLTLDTVISPDGRRVWLEVTPP